MAWGLRSVASFTGDESFLVLFARCDVDGKAPEMSWNAIDHDGMTTAFQPKDSTVRSAHLEILHHHLTGMEPTLN
jgi:hypothetical protein